MYLIYIDESGSSTYKEMNVDYTLASVIIEESNWQAIKNEIDRIKILFFPNLDPDDIEIHTKEIFHKQNIFWSLKNDKNFDFLRELYTAISNMDLTINAIHIFKKNLKNKQDTHSYPRNFTPEEIAWTFLNNRVSKYLDKIMQKRKTEGKPATFGLYLIDRINKKYDHKRKKRIIKYFTTSKLKIGFFKPVSPYMLNDPVFVDSSFHILIQIADLIAFVIHRKHNSNKNSKIDTYVEEFYNLIIPKFDNDSLDPSTYLNYGLKLYP